MGNNEFIYFLLTTCLEMRKKSTKPWLTIFLRSHGHGEIFECKSMLFSEMGKKCFNVLGEI